MWRRTSVTCDLLAANSVRQQWPIVVANMAGSSVPSTMLRPANIRLIRFWRGRSVLCVEPEDHQKIDEVTGAGLFTLLFAEAVRAPRVGMIVPRVMLAQQVLAVVVAVRGAHDRVDMIAGGFVVRIDDS